MKLGTWTTMIAAVILSISGYASANPITYTGFLISDVTIGEQKYTGARVYISFDADTDTVEPLTGTSGFANYVGKAHVKVIGGNHRITADFAPNQIYVYFDVTNSSIGFGSYVGGTGYPLSLTAHEDSNGLTENSSVGAVSDIMRTHGLDATNYTAATAKLVTDLTNATTLSAAASSCVGFIPMTSVCTNLSPTALRTNKGDFYLFEPYTDDTGGPYSVNWGSFWSTLKK